ncbi:MAG TPA: hypothetical protein VE863_05395 [Pyrinomonadaceae bacterium]|jgi:hypothetical protein|nr:hypothetical protein [Pyrinomonadaceae bacterium]
MLKKIAPFIILLTSVAAAVAQDATSQTATAAASPDPQQQQEEKAKLEKKALALLEQVVTDSQGLRLPENKLRVQIAAADMLWDKNPARARGLLSDAGALLGQMIVEVDRSDRDDMQAVNQLRQELVLTAGRHDADLGYQLLRATQPQQPVQNAATITQGRGNNRMQFVFDQPANGLEQQLLSVVASTDPKYAYQKAVESLDKNEFPSSLTRILTQLQSKDQELFKKLSDKTLNRLASDSLLSNSQASIVAISLLQPGPISTNGPASSDATASSTSTTNLPSATNPQPARTNTNGRTPVLNESSYHDLLDSTITAALSVTSAGPIGNFPRGNGGGAVRVQRGPQQQTQSPPDDAQIRQNNARSLLFSLQGMLPLVDQYLPDRAQSVRQKLTDLGINTNNAAQGPMNAMRALINQNTSSDSLVTAASTAPAQVQSRLYQSAAQKAIDEGNIDKAVDIATNHLDESGRNAIMQAVDFKKLTMTASPEKLNEIKQKLAALPSDNDRIKYLIDLAKATQKDNQKLALRFMDDAHNLVSKRATNYDDFGNQLKVADAYATIDAKKSFEILDAGIAQLNELLQAATVLNGFEVDIFKDGEMSLRGNDDLVGMLVRFGGELATLAKVDFDGARSTADKFQMPEPRLNARLMIVQNILGTQPVNQNNRGNQNIRFFARGQ